MLGSLCLSLSLYAPIRGFQLRDSGLSLGLFRAGCGGDILTLCDDDWVDPSLGFLVRFGLDARALGNGGFVRSSRSSCGLG